MSNTFRRGNACVALCRIGCGTSERLQMHCKAHVFPAPLLRFAEAVRDQVADGFEGGSLVAAFAG